MIASDEAVELVVEHVADGWLEREPFFLGAGRVGPLDLLGHFEPGRPAFGKDLEARCGRKRLASPQGARW